MARIPFSVNQIARAVWGYIGGAAGTVADRAVNTTFWNGTAVTTPNTAGTPVVDAVRWLGTTIAAVDTAGYPKVTVKNGTGTGEISLASGLVQTVTTNPGAIRAIQRRTMTIADTATTGTSTLSPTLTATGKSELRLLGWTQQDNTDAKKHFVMLELTNTTTVTASVAGAANGAITISYEVTELY